MSEENFSEFLEPNETAILEDDWKTLRSVKYIFAKDSGSLLEGEALRVIDAQLAKALYEAEKMSFAVIKINELSLKFHEKYIEPICEKKQLPLSKQDKQHLELFQNISTQLLAYRRKSLEATRELVTVLERHNYHT